MRRHSGKRVCCLRKKEEKHLPLSCIKRHAKKPCTRLLTDPMWPCSTSWRFIHVGGATTLKTCIYHIWFLPATVWDVQFPVTKTAQAGTAKDILLHFFDSPHRPYESVNLAMAIHFMCLVSGPLNGRVFPSSSTQAPVRYALLIKWHRIGEVLL